MAKRSHNLRFFALIALTLLWAGTGLNALQDGSPTEQKSVRKASKRKVSKNALAAGPEIPWAPPDVDAVVPPVETGAECNLPEVLKKAGEQVQEMVSNLPRFAAREHLEHAELRPDGTWKSSEPVSFEYLVETKEVRPGYLIMDETRDEGQALAKFPAHLATQGLPVLAWVFHPYDAGDFEFRCEGRSNWDGYYAWQVHFQQRADKLPRLRGYRVKNQLYLLKIKGRAWISEDNFQVLHIDSDLMEPVPQVEYVREHLSVDYRPVHFSKTNEDLWLQQRAEVFMDVRGHRYRRVHTFTNFQLFSVDTQEKVTLPKDP